MIQFLNITLCLVLKCIAVNCDQESPIFLSHIQIPSTEETKRFLQWIQTHLHSNPAILFNNKVDKVLNTFSNYVQACNY